MELRTADPRKLKLNPNNPRRTKASPDADAQLTANIKAIGIIQPPLVKQKGKHLEIVAGERRVKCAIAAGVTEIHVLVNGDDDGADPVRSLAENVQRAQLGPVDQWRAIEGLCGSGWSEEAIATAFSFTVRTIQKLRLLAGIHPAMLDSMAFNLPREDELRVIAAASLEEQEAVWKRHKPRRGHAPVWYEIARALHKVKLPARVARFDDETARNFGVVWHDDLFGPADEDNRSTTNVEEFFAAQHHWLEANLPENGVILEQESYGEPRLPPHAERCYGTARDGDRVGLYVHRQTAEIREVAFRLIERASSRAGSKADAEADAAGTVLAARPEITRKGAERIGDLRTDALHRALQEAPIDDGILLGMLVLALGGSNVSVHGAAGASRADRGAIARRLIEGGKLTADHETLRQAAREILVQVLSCREGMSKSGVVAQVAGDAIGADRYLASMADDDFLKCLSKAGIERAANEAGVPSGPKTGKDIRAALIAHVGQGTYVLPAARFALNDVELEALRESIADDAAGPYVPEASDEDDDEQRVDGNDAYAAGDGRNEDDADEAVDRVLTADDLPDQQAA